MSYGATSTGFHRKSYDEILDSLRARARLPEYFGPDADISPYGPLGILIELMAYELSTAWEGLEENYNDAYVDTATGVALDRVVKIAGITRDQAVKYSTQLSFTGVDETVIPEGFRVRTASGIEYSTIEDISITSGTATVTAEASEYGYSSIVLSDQLTQIVSPLVGVYTVTNTTDAAGGNPMEPDFGLRKRAIEYASINSKDVGSITELKIILEADSDVRSCHITENSLPVPADPDGTPTPVLGGGLLPYSLLFVVDGGSDQHVAELIYKYKQGGVALNGDVTYTITDDSGTDHMIKFSRPTVVPVWISYAIQTGDGWNESSERLIYQKTVEIIGGTDTYTDGEEISIDYTGLFAGDDVLPLPLYGFLSDIPGVVNATVLMGTDSGDVTHVSLTMAPDEIARVYTANIEITIL